MLDKNQILEVPGQDSQYKNKSKLNKKVRVDINILLNRIRADKKKEKLETYLIISFIGFSILVTGLFVSL